MPARDVIAPEVRPFVEERELHVATVPRAAQLGSPGVIGRAPCAAIAGVERAEWRPDTPVQWITAAFVPDTLRSSPQHRGVQYCSHGLSSESADFYGVVPHTRPLILWY